MKNIIIALLLIGILAVAGCSNQPAQTSQERSVATTFYPLFEATKMVTGDTAEVFSIVPLASEPHSFKPAPQDILKLNKADAFVTMGIQFEPFEEDLINGAASSVVIIPAGKNIALIEYENKDHHDEHGDEEGDHEDEHEEESHHEDEHAHEEEHDDHETDEEHHEHHHEGADPHIWLSPKNMQVMVNNVKAALVEIDPENKAVYEQTAQQSIAQLSQLDQEYKTALASCKKDTVLVNHNAFSYLARDYGFTSVAISGLSPESEPTPQQIKKLIDEAEEHDLQYIFYEELVDPRIAQTIADEVGAQVLELSPLGGEEEEYFSLMRKNLANLKIAMECS